MHYLIALNFGIHKGVPKANRSIIFGANQMNVSGFMTDYLRKTSLINCHAYKLNRFMERVENQFVD